MLKGLVGLVAVVLLLACAYVAFNTPFGPNVRTLSQNELRDYTSYLGTHHSEPREGVFEIADAVRVGCRMADRLGFQVAGPAPSTSFDDLLACLPSGAAAKLKPEAGMALELADRINAVECSLM